MKKWKWAAAGVLVIGVAALPACSIFGFQGVKEPKYRVAREAGASEIREYDPVIVARTQIAGDYKQGSNAGFRRLADYIFGNNQKQQKVEMTAPVIQEQKSEKIAMTAPVLQQPAADGWQMEFVMPEGYTLETLPKPVDPLIELAEVPARKVAVLRYRGRLTEANIKTKTAELEAWIKENNLTAKAAPQSAGYDPPWTIPMFRRNEVLVEIE